MADKDIGMDERRGGIFGRGREQVRTPPVERSGGLQARGAEGSLPELRLTQAVKSPEPIVKVEPNKPITPEMGIIQPYREYTIALANGSSEIQILDEKGRKIQDLTNTQTMIVDWPSYRNGVKEYVTFKNMAYNTYNHVEIREFPEYQRNGITEFIKKTSRLSGKDRVHIPSSAWQIDTSNLTGKRITTGDGYIIINQPGNYDFITFQTKNEQGTELPPRNWRRFDSVNGWEGSLPANIAREVSLIVSPDETFGQQIDNGYSAVAMKDRLAVTKPGQKIEDAEFIDRVANIGQNVCLDPKAKGVIYYCATDNPKTILKLDTTKDPTAWQTEVIELPKEYKNIRNLRLDPTGNFFTFESSGDFVMLSKDTLQEVKRIPKFINAMLDDEGRIRGVDEKGHLVIYDANFQEVAQEADKRRIARIAQGLTADLFRKETTVAPKVEVEQFQHLVPVKTDFETQFNTQLQTTATLADISSIREALGKLKTRLLGERLPPDQISFITQGIEDSIRAKEHVLALPIVNEGLTALDSKLSGNLTLAIVSEAKGDFAKLRSLEGLVDEGTRAKIRTLENKFSQQSAELFKREGAVIEKDVGDLVTGVRGELEAMTSMPDFADWQEFRLPQLVSRLGSLANDCPLEASDTQKKILAARRQLQELSRGYETRFKENYALVREKASQVLGERVELMKVDMDSFAERLRGRGFKDRTQAETYVSSSEALGAIRTEIEELSRQNPDAAKELDRALKIRIANIMSEIERGGLTSIAETGQQMELFGRTLFPKWEASVKEKTQKKVDLIFMPNVRSEGPGVSADQIYGDVGLAVINSRGGIEKIRLYEGWDKEDRVRLGIKPLIPPSYVTHAEFDKIRKEYSDWSKGEKSEIRQNLGKKSQVIRELRNQRRGVGENKTPQEDETWRTEYDKALDNYLKFYAENHISILHRVDRVKNAPESEYENGKGFVPEWQSHWTTDEQTETYLEDMAKALKMQIDLQEGLLDLKGHAGSGKDVLIKMFANRTNRPYFSIDCSKWTTEFELSEDVMLESKEGASQTVKVPSVVLNAITTPGAVMYFNEISAMPEQAQIFLHGLTDEKRTLTLKTSSGKAIKADKSVLLVSSRNPGYPGTFEPQFATKSRMVGLQVDYPPLLGDKDPNDRNPNSPYSASEALRIARSVDSLADFTYEANPKHNDFVKVWNKNVNGIENDAPELTVTQRFDLEVILTMVQFANRLREGFILKFEKARASEARGKLLVDQPITGREVRRMAYFLSKMSAEEKTTANPEVVTRSLIERFFLSHIDKRDEREEIKTAMATWTSSKRPAA